jgi:hypothetical protein
MDNNTMDKKDVWIFIKLFTTTGCSWILLLINVFIYNQVVTVIIASINSLQGLYIFLSRMISTPDRRVNGTINVAMTISFEEMKHFQSPYPIETPEVLTTLKIIFPVINVKGLT